MQVKIERMHKFDGLVSYGLELLHGNSDYSFTCNNGLDLCVR